MSTRSCQLNAGFRAALGQTARTPVQEPPAGREHAVAETLSQAWPDLVSMSSAVPGVTEAGHMDAVRRRGLGWR